MASNCNTGKKSNFENFRFSSKMIKISFFLEILNFFKGGATERTEYVKELMKYMDIDSVGHCLHNKDMPQPDTRRSHGDKIREKVRNFLEISTNFHLDSHHF